MTPELTLLYRQDCTLGNGKFLPESPLRTRVIRRKDGGIQPGVKLQGKPAVTSTHSCNCSVGAGRRLPVFALAFAGRFGAVRLLFVRPRAGIFIHVHGGIGGAEQRFAAAAIFRVDGESDGG